MSLALNLAAVFIALIAASGFLLGQLFFASFSLPAFVAGAAGLVSSGATFAMASQSRWAPKWVIGASTLAIAGVAFDAGNFYRHLNIPGNHYAWELAGPFAGCLAFVAYIAMRRLAKAARDA